jgi:amino acid adenylation domain-containing protein
VKEGVFVFPTSFAQQRLWFLHQWQPDTPLYNIARPFRLIGRLDVSALERSVNEIVRRHESLRTSFSIVDGQPVQVVTPALTVTLPVVDLSSIPDVEREAEALRLTSEEARLPFDLSHGPLLRVTLLRLAEQEHRLLLTLHHIVSDGWSMGVLFRELSALYGALSTGKPSPLAELPIQYPDFAVWQRQWLQREVLKGQLAYWKEKLADAPAALELPTDRPRPPVHTYRGTRQSLLLPKELNEALKALGRRQGVTLFMTLLAAFQTLLYRYTGQDDIAVGSPIAGRNRTEVEGLIGFFVNTLVLRSDLSENPSFLELLGRVRKVCLEAYAHQEVPFEKLVEELKPERNLSHSPLFQVLFALQNVPMTELRLTDLSVNTFKADRGTATFDLSLLMFEESSLLKGTIEYNTDLFDEATISRMQGHFQTLLESIVADPDRRLSDLSLLTEPERHRLIVEWNNGMQEYPEDRCLQQLFEEQVERTPDAVAIVFEGQELTYQELNRRANRVAHSLIGFGVGPEVLVGICLERSLEVVVGILGVLKAGGAYVPLDPLYPKDRLAFMLEDSAIQVVMTEERLTSCLPPHKAHVAYLDALDRLSGFEASQASIINPDHRTTAGNAAYVIYTSGSTGKPKGVLITHDNVTRLLRATQSWFHFDRDDVWTLFHSYAFDFSVWEIWGALLYGGRLVVVPYWVCRSPELFYKMLREEKVTVLNQTPSAFGQLIETENVSSHPADLALRLVIFGGEALDFQNLKPWLERHGDQHPRLVNMYGITETTVHVTYRPITTANLSASRGSLIGKPIPDLEIYILDQSQNLAPIGVSGELYVGGAGVGRGYLNRPELTAERFVPNPFRPQAGQRLYRSGDLARYLPTGDLEYLGRIDAQVKIRGFRIELGEIEAVLRQHASVREVVVIARGERPADQRLLAYVVAAQPAPTVSELNGFLRQKLPAYMMPANFVFLEALPLTSNGKIDRGKLPDPDQSRPEQESSFVAPRTPVEELLAEIWRAVLNLQQVGVHDNFFELGGHSLLLTQVASRIEQTFQVSLPLRVLFDAPTIADQSVAIAGAQLKEEDAAEVARMVEELKQLSPDEVAALLEAERRSNKSEDEKDDVE